MISRAKVSQAAPASSTTTARLPSPCPPRVGARAANDDADAASKHNVPDPLWVIVIGMAVFFGITAVLLIAD
jgi:hypothetical protein